jgi:excisionase family DNA binding protein
MSKSESKALNPFVLGGTSPPNSQEFFDKKIEVSSNLECLSECWLSTEEAAEHLKISPASLRNNTSNGKVPYYKFGRLNRYRKSDLDKILLSQKRGEFL